MKRFISLLATITLFYWQGLAQSTLYLTSSGGNYTSEKWVSITDGPNGTGNIIWAQGNGTYGDSQGLVTDASFIITNGTTYYINCYDRYADGWDGTTYEIRTAPNGLGQLVANNSGSSPNDLTDNDATSAWETPIDELEGSELFSFTPQSCPDPSITSATQILSNSLLLNWVENGSAILWDIEYGNTNFTPTGTPTISSTSTNPHLVSGLSALTAYDFYVRSDCGGGSESQWVGPYTISTAGTCGFFTLDLEDSFGDGWNGGYIDVYVNGVLFSSGITLINGYGPESTSIPVNQGDVVSIDYTAGSYSYENNYSVYDQATNLLVTEGTGSSIPNDIGDYTLNTGLKACPNCPEPTALNASNITPSSANLTWTEMGSATLWEIEYGMSNFTQGTGISLTTSNLSETISSLSSSTVYDVYIKAICGAGDSSVWSVVHSFETACLPVIAPYTESFENNGSLPTCWKQGASNAESWIFSTTGGHVGNAGIISGSSSSGNYFAYVDDSSPHSATTSLESPLIDVSALSNPTLSFYLISNNENNSNVDFSVDVWDGSAWNVGLYTNNTNTLNGAWELITISLSSLTLTGNIQLRFVVDENNGSDYFDDVAIDDIKIDNAPTNDLGVISINSVPSGCSLEQEEVNISVKNYGVSTISTFDLMYNLNGTNGIIETVNTNILPGDTFNYSFTALADMSTPNSYSINGACYLAGDSSPLNDSLLNGWTTIHAPTSLTFNGNETINTLEGVNTIICADGLVQNPINSCYQLSELVIDSLIHPWNGDVEIWLISPNNDSVEVSTGNGGSSANYINVRFSDTAQISINGATPSPGVFKPEEATGFSKFNGLDPNGIWTLWVSDNFPSIDDGQLFKWHLEFKDYNHIVDLGSDTNACSEDLITLSAKSGNYYYLWSTGDTTQQISIDTTSLGGNGTYNIWVAVTEKVSGCASVDTLAVTFSTCLGVNKLNKKLNSFIYPNPSNGIFTLNINTSNVKELNVTLMNLQGQTVYSKNNFVNIENVHEQIDLSSNAKGVYFINITSDKGVKTHKVILE